MTIETFKTGKQRKKDRRRTEYSRPVRQLQKVVTTCSTRIPEEEKRKKGTEAILKTIMTENFPLISMRHQNRSQGAQRKSKKEKKWPPPKEPTTKHTYLS